MSYTMNCLKNLDLERLGLSGIISQNIKRNRMSSVQIKVTDKDGEPIKGAKISVNQTDSEFKFGCNAFMVNQFDNEKANDAYTEKFKKVFNQAVVPFFWTDDEPEKGKYRFEKGSAPIYRRPPADEVLEWCAKLNIQPKGHNMVWSAGVIGMPKWMPKDKTEMQKAIDDRIRILADRYADKIPVWDVCIEIAGAGGYDELPEEYEVRAHKLAGELFPDCHLILNDCRGFYGRTYRQRRSITYQMAKKIMYAGGRIDGLGIQNHFFFKEEDVLNDDRKMFKPTHIDDKEMLQAEHIMNMLNTYSGLCGSLHISEITIPSYDKTPEKLDVQAKIVENLYRIWFSTESVKSAVWWNLVDGYAFINPANPDWDEDYYGGGLLNRDFSEKPAYKVIDHLVNKEWHTQFDTVSDNAGQTSAEMFHGTYDIMVNGEKFTEQVNKNTSIIKIVL